MDSLTQSAHYAVEPSTPYNAQHVPILHSTKADAATVLFSHRVIHVVCVVDMCSSTVSV